MNHTNAPSAIEQRAYAFAAAQYFTFTDEYSDESTHYEGYIKIVDHYNDYLELDTNVAVVWSKYEDDELDLLLHEIEDCAQAIIHQVEQALQDAKAGLVRAAIESELPDDFNQLDMKALAQSVAEST